MTVRGFLQERLVFFLRRFLAFPSMGGTYLAIRAAVQAKAGGADAHGMYGCRRVGVVAVGAPV